MPRLKIRLLRFSLQTKVMDGVMVKTTVATSYKRVLDRSCLHVYSGNSYVGDRSVYPFAMRRIYDFQFMRKKKKKLANIVVVVTGAD